VPHDASDLASTTHRLQCASAAVPVDHDHPDAGSMPVDVVRIPALDAQPWGSIFFNFGGPGEHPLDHLPGLADAWSSARPDDPAADEKHALMQHYDLVAVVPRGLRPQDALRCEEPAAPLPQPLHESLDADNWTAATLFAGDFARACSAHPLTPFLTTSQQARDIDVVRQQLRLPVIHFVAQSYGTRVAATYAVLFPRRVGRFVFDSSMDVFGTFAQAIRDSIREQDYIQRIGASLPQLTPLGPAGFAINISVPCNDEPWPVAASDLYDEAIGQRRQYPSWMGEDVAQSLVCSHWPIQRRVATSTIPLRDTPELLMVHAELDPATPLAAASRMADAIPGARLVVARGMVGHRLVGRSRTPCVEQAVGRFLLHGQRPPLKHTSCAFVP
jgi:pimeloyl-ACP methyl ester carboxylesterase